MKVNATCKFCHKPLVLTVSDEYHHAGDPYKLIRLAACNSCADNREQQRTVTENIGLVCALVSQSKNSKNVKEASREALTRLIQKYLDLIERRTRIRVPFDDAIVESLISGPRCVYDVLSRLWPNEQQPELMPK
jgi:hypothetical protein